MDKDSDKDKKPRSRSPLPRHRRGGRQRSRSPLYRREDEISNDTQRHEVHLKKGRLFVGNVEPQNVSRRDLSDAFSHYGEVMAVSIHNGYAFVQMDSEKSANAAVNLENGRMLNGRKINVEFSSAALKAGARLKRLSFRTSRSPPPRADPAPDPYYERERRLARILSLENQLQQEMGYLQRDPVDYDAGYRSSRRNHADVYSSGSYDRPSESRSTSYSSRDIERDFRQKPRSDYYERPPLSPPRSASYSQRDVSPGYRGSNYGREWENSRSSYPTYQSSGGSSGGRQNW